MIDDVFVFDGVAHPSNADPKNALGRPGQMFAQHLCAFHATLTPEGETVLPADEWLKQWDMRSARWSSTSPTPTCWCRCLCR
ncbi:MAG: hypothetical protein M3P95_03960 [Actinomycetota bacterium]|nr:hypothetical protein [Actinomycetota bacterium]